MQELSRQHCPYCGEPIELIVDCSVSEQEYIEDCQVCCRPIELAVRVSEDGEIDVSLGTDND